MKAAHKLGFSRSELYTKAVAEYLAHHAIGEVRKTLDELYAKEPSQLPTDLVRLQTNSLEKDNW